MADAVDQPETTLDPSAAAQAEDDAGHLVAAPDAGERVIGRVLRFGTLVSGGLFLLSVVLETVHPAAATPERLNVLRGVAASILVMAPVMRLLVSGAWLAFNREWRYAAAAATVLVLLAIGMGLGWSH